MIFSHDTITNLVRTDQFDFKVCAETLSQQSHENISADQVRLAFSDKESINATDKILDASKTVYENHPLNNLDDYENIMKSMEISHEKRRASVFAKVCSSLCQGCNDDVMHSLPANIRMAIQVSLF